MFTLLGCYVTENGGYRCSGTPNGPIFKYEAWILKMEKK